MAQEPDGCLCDAFAEALSATVIQRDGDTFYLGNRETARSSWYSIVYGPAITHCPFCGSRLVARPLQAPRG